MCLICVSRAGKPPVGLHLDVAKGDKLIQVSGPVMQWCNSVAVHCPDTWTIISLLSL
ncbi:hypothetical protein E2C01_083671 [Portunus trituberculatus]|uniref:Uncharacterized protein n=1 Tax=Portunus trituberculatus TaxID=210409 RepID=A0A5B7IT26_PORTR|nr:hypothetical protein [Portunus trituberculatus]